VHAAADSKPHSCHTPLPLPHFTARLPAMCTCHTWTTTRHRWTHTHAHAIANSCCPSLEPHPFRSKEHSTASGTPSEHTLATSPPGTGDPRTAFQFREPCRPSGRLAMTDGMDRCSGAPPLHLGWVRRGARPSGGARTHARGQRRRWWAKRPATHDTPLAARTPHPHVHTPRLGSCTT